MSDFIAMIVTGLLFGVLGFFIGIDIADDHMVLKKYIHESIESCEQSLPRNEFCTMVAIPESETRDD